MRKLLYSVLLIFTFLSTVQLGAQVGLSSYYADDFQGRKTASGERYDKNALTAAHKEFPFGTFIRVTRLDNGKSVVVKVNDRGPYFEGYVVDLSRRAAKVLGIIDMGTAKVKVELEKNTSKKEKPIVRNIEIGNLPDDYDEIPNKVKEKIASNEVKETPKVIYVDPKKGEEFTSKGAPIKEKVIPAKKKEISKPKKAEIVVTATKKVKEKVKEEEKVAVKEKSTIAYLTDKNFKTYDLYKIELKRPIKDGYGVQIGTFANYENVLKQIAVLQGKSFDNILVSIEKNMDGKSLYKVILGPFSERKKATNYKKNAAKRYKIKGFVVDLSSIKYEK